MRLTSTHLKDQPYLVQACQFSYGRLKSEDRVSQEHGTNDAVELSQIWEEGIAYVLHAGFFRIHLSSNVVCSERLDLYNAALEKLT